MYTTDWLTDWLAKGIPKGKKKSTLSVLFGDLLTYACIGGGGGIAKEGESTLACF